MGIDGIVPRTPIQQCRVGIFRALLPAQGFQHAAALGATVGQVLHLTQVAAVFVCHIAGFGAPYERFPSCALCSFGRALRLHVREFLRGAGAKRAAGLPEVKAVRDELPCSPGSRRGEVPVGQFGDLRDRCRAARKQLPCGLHIGRQTACAQLGQ